MPTPPTVALTEFFHADTVASVHPLPVSWYLISSLCVYLCSWMHIMSILCSTSDVVSSGSYPILFKVLTLNVAICILCLHFSNFCWLSWFFEHWGQGSNFSRTRLIFTCAKSDAVFTSGLSVGHVYLSMAVFILIHRSQTYRWAAVVPRIELIILTIKPWDSYTQDQVRQSVRPPKVLSASLYVHHTASYEYAKKVLFSVKF